MAAVINSSLRQNNVGCYSQIVKTQRSGRYVAVTESRKTVRKKRSLYKKGIKLHRNKPTDAELQLIDPGTTNFF